MDCIFCKIVAGQIPAAKIYEDDDVLAFLDAIPNTKGHALVVPKVHFENIFDIDDTVLQKVVVTGKHLAMQMKAVLGAIAINITSNNGEYAGQIVPHFHLHVIPRYKDDGLQMYGPREHVQQPMEELQKIADKLKG